MSALPSTCFDNTFASRLLLDMETVTFHDQNSYETSEVTIHNDNTKGTQHSQTTYINLYFIVILFLYVKILPKIGITPEVISLIIL